MTANNFRKFKHKMLKKHSKPSGANQATRAILSYLNSDGFFAWRNNTTGIYDPEKKIFRKNAGLNGVADILGIEKATGRLIAVEVKVGKDVLSPDQKYFLESIRKSGGIAIVAGSAGDVVDQLQSQNT